MGQRFIPQEYCRSCTVRSSPMMIQLSPRPCLNQYKDFGELSLFVAGLKIPHHESLALPLCLRAADCLLPPKNVLADVLHLYSSLVWRAIAHSLTQNHTRTQYNIGNLYTKFVNDIRILPRSS